MRYVLTTALAAFAPAALCATVELSGSLTNEDVAHSVGEAAQRWEVEFLGGGGDPVYADGSNWQFRATERASGATKTFRSGTELGFFVLARTYESRVLIGADLGAGVWGFSVYNLEQDRKVVEFWASSPHLSPDNRYLVYRNWSGRQERFDPTIRLLDLSSYITGIVEGPADRQELGVVVFPRPPAADKPELYGSYGHTITESWFDQVAWDMDNEVLYLTGTDRSGCLNLIAYGLAEKKIACYLPLTNSKLPTEYFDDKQLTPTGIALQSPYTVVVTTLGSSFGVRSTHEISLRSACGKQNREFVESLEP